MRIEGGYSCQISELPVFIIMCSSCVNGVTASMMYVNMSVYVFYACV
jgi:hypothetical protein